MNNLVMSLTLYLIAANLVAGTIYFFGQKKIGLLWFEYPFIYVPWVILLLIMPEFVEIVGYADLDPSLTFFLFLMQGFSCGILGGIILLPRFFIKAETGWDKLKITMISSLAVGVFYIATRYLLLEMFKWVLPKVQ